MSAANLKQFCLDTLSLLKDSGKNYGEIYVEKSMELYRYKNSLSPKIGLFSTASNNIFQDILNVLGGAKWKITDEFGNSLEYEVNFFKFIKLHL